MPSLPIHNLRVDKQGDRSGTCELVHGLQGWALSLYYLQNKPNIGKMPTLDGLQQRSTRLHPVVVGGVGGVTTLRLHPVVVG